MRSGERIYTHNDPGTPVLDRQVALTAIDVLKGVLTRGTARAELADLASRQPAFGKTGTQEKNWTAFFVGATPFLSTAVLVRDPDRYTPMASIPEFANAGVDRVQGGTFPARIWGNMMDAIGLERVGLDADWERPGPPARPPARLYLPGNECVYQVVAYEPADTEPARHRAAAAGAQRAGRRSGRRATGRHAPAGRGAGHAAAGDAAAGRRQPPATQPPPTHDDDDRPPRRRPRRPRDRPPPTTPPPRPVLTADETGTTIPPDVLDPRAPLPSVPLDRVVQACGVTP